MTVSPLLNRALAAASDTKFLVIASGALRQVPTVFRQAFGPQARAIVVADRKSHSVAGEQVAALLKSAGVVCESFVFPTSDFPAEWPQVDELDAKFGQSDAIPVAVGAGVINDLVKLSSCHTGRQYLCVATAASMDGYTAYAASITKNGSKQTFDCPAPRAVVADLDVIAAAPPSLNAAGYADLIAKIPAGADWTLADALGVEPIDTAAWDFVQTHIRDWCTNAAGVQSGDKTAIAGLVEGLMMTGFAMQSHKSSRPASGAEHQFSHVWDMQHHTHEGYVVPHGFKVGIGSLAMTRLYEWLFKLDIANLDIDHACNAWPADVDTAVQQARSAYDIGEMSDKAELEVRSKYIDRAALQRQLQQLKAIWATLKNKLARQLLPLAELRDRLMRAGAPTESRQIGITEDRLKQTHWQAYFIRRRFTVLDLAVRTGLLKNYLATTN